MNCRKPNRFKRYDYSQPGFYFVTVCPTNRVEWFGAVVDGRMALNPYGEIVQTCWDDLPNHYPNIELDVFSIMPNHVHGIIKIGNGLPAPAFVTGGPGKPFPTDGKNYGLSEILRGFKTFSSRRINEKLLHDDRFQWQKSFHDHIIRNEMSLCRIREYVLNNERQWEFDKENLEGRETKK